LNSTAPDIFPIKTKPQEIPHSELYAAEILNFSALRSEFMDAREGSNGSGLNSARRGAPIFGFSELPRSIIIIKM
jgi:hypothetical protein